MIHIKSFKNIIYSLFIFTNFIEDIFPLQYYFIIVFRVSSESKPYNKMNGVKRLNKKHLIFKPDQRKRKRETLIMKMFFTVKKDKTQSPKKEYVRCKVIRGHKKLIRNLLENSVPKKGIAKFKLGNKVQALHYRKFHDHLNENEDLLSNIALTESGPLTDGKNKERTSQNDSYKNSYNNEFCADYFKSPVVRHSFKLFFEVVFSKYIPKNLKKRFGFKCCVSDTHTLECYEKWQCLKYYLQNEIFETLGYEDEYFDDSNPEIVPDISNIYELIYYDGFSKELEKDKEDHNNFKESIVK